MAIDPKDTYALTRKGNFLDNQGDHMGAIRYYNKALAIDPNYIIALNGKGNALAKLGKDIEATKYYEKAIEILKSNHSN